MKTLAPKSRLAVPGFLLLGLIQAHAASLYVSPAGDDRNPGTADRPVQTLTRARDLARASNGNLTEDLTIHLHGGVYRLSEPLVLEPLDSGTNGHSVVFSALAGETPVVSGGVPIQGWKLVDPAKNLWAAPAPAAVKNTRQFFVDGVRALRARGRLPVALKATETGYTADSPLLAAWRNPSDIEFVYTGGNSVWSEREEGLGSWTEPRCPVASIVGTAITMAQPCWDNSTKRAMLPASSRFKRAANLVGPKGVGKEPVYVENAYELLGTPGQWYFDRPAAMFYYVPRAGEDLTKADVEVPVLETLVVGRGTAEHPIHHLVFSGLQFSYATWLFPSSTEGFSEIQANYTVTGKDGYARQGLGHFVPDGMYPYGAWTKPPGNVAFAYGHQLRFENDVFAHLGGAGLELGHGSQEDDVVGCVFTDISANGLELGGVDLPLSTNGDIPCDNRIRNNHIYGVAAEYHGGIGICVGYARRTRIEHNQIDHIPYSAISLGWGGWPDKVEEAGQPNYSENNVVAYNLIFQHMLLLSDGAAIYTQGLTGPSLAEGEKLLGNVIFDQFGSGHALYTDNGCKNVTALGNVLFHTNHDNWGGRHKDFYDGAHGENNDAFDFEGNYWQQGEPDGVERNVTLRDNHLIGALEQAPAAIRDGAGLETAYKGLLKKRLTSPAAPEPPSRIAVSSANGAVYVAWCPPSLEGSAPVRSYTVRSSLGEQTTLSTEELWSKGYATLTGLAAGTTCTFTVTATSADGTSPASMPSSAITVSAKTSAKPGAPAEARAYAGDGRASIHFQAPAADGGSAITAYAFTVRPGDRKVLLTGRAVLTLSGKHVIFGVVDGLQPGTYTFDVTAINSAGESNPVATNPVTIGANK